MREVLQRSRDACDDGAVQLIFDRGGSERGPLGDADLVAIPTVLGKGAEGTVTVQVGSCADAHADHGEDLVDDAAPHTANADLSDADRIACPRPQFCKVHRGWKLSGVKQV